MEREFNVSAGVREAKRRPNGGRNVTWEAKTTRGQKLSPQRAQQCTDTVQAK